jgi:ABC-2 type transport system permease protein
MESFLVLIGVHARASARDKSALYFTFIFPTVILVVFGALFGSGKVAGTDKTVIDFIGPGVLCFGIAVAAMIGTSSVVVRWRRDHLLRLVQMTPVPTGVVIGSRLAVAVVIAAAQAVVFGAVASLPGLDLRLPLTGVLVAAPVILAGVLTFGALGAVIGNLARSPESVVAIGNFVLMPMAFLSGSFIPIATAPAWLQGISHAMPLRYMNAGVVDALDGSYRAASLSGLVLIGTAAALAVIATRTFVWANQR